ncbi:TMV resistance protein N-like isoform X1 [Gossypium australe]|uniref:TMV resistance protein N-like isoform X1 n=1 Tax=Gossypium australe TaxID=47621 RepID=A0A5B6VTD8_9ROSI|nr:TMV resistance protein N-like isoform X1 [Gossypium australe]
MSPHFEVSNTCGLVSLQKLLSQILSGECFNFFNVHEGNALISHMLSNKKVLVVLDDVDNLQHLKCFVGRRDWLVDDVYKPTTLNATEALQLFNLKAFNDLTKLENAFSELSKHVLKYAGGLPLALEVLGSFLCGRDVAQCRSAIERLKRDSSKEILDRLQIGFDGLDQTEQNIFLDIACFFNGEDKDFVMKVLDGCEFFRDIGIDVLVKRSLLIVNKDNKLWMHDMLQEIGRKIVREKSVDEPRKRCRLWAERDVYHVLTKKQVQRWRNALTQVANIKGWHLNDREMNKTLTLNADVFLKMKRLRVLRVIHHSNCHDLVYLSNELRLLDWTGFPLKNLPSNFQPENLVALLLSHSNIEQPWKENKSMHKLKVLNLEGSENLIKAPDFTTTPNLDTLVLKDCTRLTHVHPSIGVLKRLKLLNLKDCKSLRSLPTKIGMESLEELILSGLSSLTRLNLRDCNLFDLPSDISRLSSLERHDLGGNNFISLPSCLTQLPQLGWLRLTDCKALKSVSELPTNKLYVNIDGCTSLEIVAYPSKAFISRYSANICNSKIWAGMVAVNCFRLAENVDALTLLKKELKVFGSRAMFDIVLPGSEIPKWFSQQRGDSWIKIDLPLEVRNDSQRMGVAFCCIFVCDDASCDERLRCRAVIHDRYSSRKVDWSGWSFTSDEQVIMKDHIFIRYFSRDKLYPIFLEDKYGEHDETKNLWMIDCLDQECHQLELSMISFKYRLFKVKKCGVQIMYEKDLEEMEQIQELNSSQCCANCEDIQQHSTDDGSIGNRSLVKRKRNIYEEMDEAPQPKRMQKIFISSSSFLRLGKSLTRLQSPVSVAVAADRIIVAVEDIAVALVAAVGVALVEDKDIIGVNCFRLAENIDALTLLKKHLQVFGNSRKLFNFIIPGSEIPEIDLPLNVRNDSQWTGVALCCIFVSDDATRNERLMCRAVIQGRNPQLVNCSGWNVNYHFEQPVMKDHILIRYFSRDMLYPPISLEDKFGEHDETNNLWTTDCLDQECHQLELSFEIPNSVKVKKCGVRIVNERDLEDIQQHSADDGSILLTSIDSVRIDCCASLELIANPSKVCNVMDWARFNGIHCYRLVETVSALTLLKKHLKVD